MAKSSSTYAFFSGSKPVALKAWAPTKRSSIKTCNREYNVIINKLASGAVTTAAKDQVAHCPVCNSNKARRTETSLCTVSTCISCGHEYTSPLSIKSPEIYTDTYFEEAHKNWFAHPHIDLFRLLEKVVSEKALRTGFSTRILDAGCGKCALLNHFSDVGYRNLTGIDICRPPSDLRAGIRFIRSSIEDFSGCEQFDVIISTLAIEHVEKPSLMLKRLKEALVPGGIAIIVTNDVKTPLYLAAKLLKGFGFQEPYERLYHPHHLNHLTRTSLSALARGSGFTVLDVVGLDVPFKALDIPSKSFIGKLIKEAGVKALFNFGKLSGHRFLQVQILAG